MGYSAGGMSQAGHRNGTAGCRIKPRQVTPDGVDKQPGIYDENAATSPKLLAFNSPKTLRKSSGSISFSPA